MYRSNRCRGITELYELRKLHEARPDVVERWLGAQDHVGRTEVQALKDKLKQVDSAVSRQAPVSTTPTPQPVSDLGRSTAVPAVSSRSDAGSSRASAAATELAPKDIASPSDSLTLWASCDGADVMINLRAVPEEAGCVFVQKSRGADRIVVPARSVRLLRITKA